MQLGERIKRWREGHAKISQAALARRVEVTRAAVSQWEMGDATPTTQRLEHITEALGISLQRFWGSVPRRRRSS